MAASWDPETIERGQSVAAREARAVGIHWTFAPMVDIARDPRWGRIIEGAGEDPYLGAAVAVAQVRGFQGGELGAPDRIIAGPKHFAGYGAALGGRDYDEVNLSDSELWNVYFPPFEAAVEAGAGQRDDRLHGPERHPGVGQPWLFTEVLRDTWGFEGFVVSDANAVRNLVTHGFATDLSDAAARAVNAGVDMEMAIVGPRLRATCPRRWSRVRRARRRSTPACGGCWKRRSGWACSTRRTSTRTTPAKCSPIRPTATWPASPRSDPQCCCATRATCSRSTPAA